MTIPVEGHTRRSRTLLGLSVLAVILLSGLLLASVWPSVPGPLGNVDSTVKVWQVESILRGQLPLTYNAAALDPAGEFIPNASVVLIDGKPYAMYLNLFTGWLAAGSFVFGRMTYQLVPLLFALLAVWLTVVLVRRHRLLSDRDLWQAVLVTGFCTPLMVYAVTPWEHGIATVLAVGALILAADGLRAARDGNRSRLLFRFALAGLCLGLTPLVRPECYALALAVGLVAVIVLFVMKTPVAWCLASGAVMAAGGVVALGAAYLVFPLLFRIQSALHEQNVACRLWMPGRFWQFLFRVTPGGAGRRVLSARVADPLALTGSWLLVGAAVTGLVSGVRRSWRRHLATVVLVAALGAVTLCWGLDGVFAAVPLLTLLVFLRGEGLFREPVAMLVFGSAVTFTLLLGLLLPNAGGATVFSPRYLLPVVVPSAVVAFCLIRTRLGRAPDRWLNAMLVIVVVVSVIGLGKGSAGIWRAASISRDAERRLAALPEPLVRSWDPAPGHRDGILYHAPENFLNRRVLSVDGDEGFLKVVDVLRRKGIHRFTVVGFADRINQDQTMIARAGGTVLDKQDFHYNSTALVVELAPGRAGPAP